LLKLRLIIKSILTNGSSFENSLVSVERINDYDSIELEKYCRDSFEKTVVSLKKGTVGSDDRRIDVEIETETESFMDPSSESEKCDPEKCLVNLIELPIKDTSTKETLTKQKLAKEQSIDESLENLNMNELNKNKNKNPTTNHPAIHIKNLSIGYLKNKTVLKNINLKINKNQKIAIIGQVKRAPESRH